jgi:hypothetical protein
VKIPKLSQPNKRAKGLDAMMKGGGTSERGLYLRAATVLMEAFNRSKNETMRENSEERQRCLSMAPKLKPPVMNGVWLARARNV